MKARWYLLFGVAVVLALAAPSPPIRFLSAPGVVSEGAQMRVGVWVEPNELNRTLVLSAVEGDTEVTHSEAPLEGVESARQHWFRFLIPPCDPCLLVGAVYGVSGKELHRATQTLIVQPR